MLAVAVGGNIPEPGIHVDLEFRILASVLTEESPLDLEIVLGNLWVVRHVVRMRRDQRSRMLGRSLAAYVALDAATLHRAELWHHCRTAMVPALVAVLDECDRTGAAPSHTGGLHLLNGSAVRGDPFNNLPFHIVQRDDSFAIYSFGPDGADDHGEYGELEDGSIADDFPLRFILRKSPEGFPKTEAESAPEPFRGTEIPFEWKGVGIILASLSFGAISLWLRRRKA